MQTIEYDAFKGCTGITELDVPSNVQIVRQYGFIECTGLTKVEITCDTKFQYDVFYDCSNIEEVTVRAGNTTVMKNASEYNDTSTVSFRGEPWYHAKQGVKVKLEEGITRIGNKSFYNSTKIGELIIPTSVTEIGNYAFYGVSDSLVINYKGTSEQWTAITKGTNNDKLSTIIINYNYTGSGGE